MTDSKGSIPMAILWMTVVSLLLIWLPVIGSLLAGIVGGKTAGGVVRGLTAVVLPAILLAALLFLLSTVLTGMPMIGAIASMGVFVLILAQVGPLLIGALVGGLLA